jgi:hypothetical protein
MSLSHAQQEFALDVADLIWFINNEGFACTFGDAYRDPRVFGPTGQSNTIISAHGEYKAYGHKRSAHKRRLAIDLNLFLDGEYIHDAGPYARFGLWWKDKHPDNVWGGDWSFGDANHFEKTYKG